MATIPRHRWLTLTLGVDWVMGINPCLEVALQAAAMGISVLPPVEDGSKRPLTLNGRWDTWQRERADEEQIRLWYKHGRRGLGFVCGAVSGNLELFEFDDLNTYREFREAIEKTGLRQLAERIENGYSETTPGGGVHWLYRFSGQPASVKLASRRLADKSVKTLIETKGDGGYVVVSPSNGSVHKTGGAYTMLRGAVSAIATISSEAREALWELARGFDEMPSREHVREVPIPGQHSQSSPGNEFIKRTTWADILTKHGWTAVYKRNEVTYWRRPGKDEGISASTNYAGSDLFYPWTSSTEFDVRRGYNKFAVYTVLNHGGDFHAAARALVGDGYGGDSVRLLLGSTAQQNQQNQQDDPTNPTPASRYTLHHADEALIPQPPIDWVVDALFSRGSVSLVVGPPGSKKTYSLLDCALSVAMGNNWLDRVTQQGTVVLIDEESGKRRLNRRLAEIMRGHGAGQGTPIYYTTLEMFNLRDSDDVSAIDEIMTKLNPALVVIDALADVMPGGDENAVKDTHPVFQNLRALAEKHQVAVVVIHHANKGGSYRGSTAIAGAVDLMLMIESDKESTTIKYSTAKTRDTEPQTFGANIVFHVTDGRVYLTPAMAAGETEMYTHVEKQIIRWLLARGNRDSLMNIKASAGADAGTKNATRLAVYKLAARGFLRRCDGGGQRGEKADYEICPHRLSELSELAQ